MEEPGEQQSLKQKTAKGLFWGGMSGVLYQLISLAAGILLARYYLSPSDYGIMAMLSIFTSVSFLLQDSGFAVALINKKDARDNDYNAVFWFNAFIGIILYLILFFVSPLVASFFKTPELSDALRVMMLCVLVNGFSVTHNTFLVKGLCFKEKAIIDTTSLGIAVVAGLSLAICGFGYWSLVVQTVIDSIVHLLMRLHYSSWRPTLKISFKPLKEMFPFSIKLLFTGLFTVVNNNIFSFLLAKFFNKTITGYYYEGYKWVNMLYTFIWNIVNNVSQSVLAKVANDDERQILVFRKMIRFVAMVSFPCMIGMALVSDDFIRVTVSEKWLPSIPYIRLFCVWGAITPLNSLYANMVVSKGKSDMYMYSIISLGVLQVLFSSLLLYFTRQIMLMLLVYVSLSVLWFFVWNILARKILQVSILQILLRDVLPFFALSLVVCAVSYLVSMSIDNIYIDLFSKMVIAVVLYVVLLYLTHCKIFLESIIFFKDKLLKRK